jgi:hypothetical protein
MHIVSNLVLKLSLIVVGFVVLLAVIYAWLLPEVFGEYRTYSFLLIGLSGAAILAGYYSYQAAGILKSTGMQWLSAVGAALLVAALVGFFSFWIIFNLRGA